MTPSQPPSGPLRVAVNLLWLVPGVVGGSEDYAVGLLDALPDALDRSVAVTLLVNRSFVDAYPQLCARYAVAVAPVTGRSKAARVAAENTWLAAQLRRRRIDVVHHLGGLVPFVGGGTATVVTVHDLQPLDLPGNFSAVKRRFEAVAIPWAIRHADVVATLSGHVARSVADRFAVPADRLALVPPGASRALVDDAGDPVASGVIDRLGLTGQAYVLYPAITYPHKNHRVLIDAMAQLRTTHPDLRLVLTGGAGPAEDELAARVAAGGLGDRVVRAGRVGSAELVALYRGATAMVFPSAYEGFGLPVVEAMRLGCPVVASTAGSLPDVAGGAAVLVDPDDAAGWANAIAALVDEPDTASRLRDAGRQRAAEFTWDASARALVAAWRQADALHRHPGQRASGGGGGGS